MTIEQLFMFLGCLVLGFGLLVNVIFLMMIVSAFVRGKEKG